MQLYRNMQLIICIFIQICKNMQNKINHRLYIPRNIDIINQNYSSSIVEEYVFAEKSVS